MSHRLNLQAILDSSIQEGQLIEHVWLDICSQVFTKNFVLITDSFDNFIIQCCMDFDPLIAALPSSVQELACNIAAGWGYESIQLRSVRYLLAAGVVGFLDGNSLRGVVSPIDSSGHLA
ncbi:hypothetical protein [Alicycliphilus denitrificans]|uniref:hypothetical protein n=1 Tax=Alicycliphilus denitrificans TaxID=179636 RepID=UPI00384BCE85